MNGCGGQRPVRRSLQALESARCRLAALQPSDHADANALYVNPDVRRYLGGAMDPDRARAQFADTMRHVEAGDAYWWSVRHKATGTFMGLVSLAPCGHGEAEVGYELLPEWWQQGYGSEVVRAILAWALEGRRFAMVLAKTHRDNQRSRALLERLGMRLDRIVDRAGAPEAIYVLTACRA